VNKVAFVNRVAYSSGFQISFGKAFKCIHVAWSKFQIIGVCQGTWAFNWVLVLNFFFSFVLTIQEFKVRDRSGMSTIFYVFKMDYNLYAFFFIDYTRI